MFRNTHRVLNPLSAAMAVVALAAPSTSVAYQDYRSADATDAAIEAQRATPDLQDLRDADARDSGRTSPPPPEIAESPGFDWGDAGIGAGSVLGLVLVALSVMLTVVHRRNRTATT